MTKKKEESLALICEICSAREKEVRLRLNYRAVLCIDCYLNIKDQEKKYLLEKWEKMKT